MSHVPPYIDSVQKYSHVEMLFSQNVTSDSKPSVYNQFIELLQQHCQQEWTPRQVTVYSHLFAVA